MNDAAMNDNPAPADSTVEVSWFSALCDDDYEYLLSLIHI